MIYDDNETSCCFGLTKAKSFSKHILNEEIPFEQIDFKGKTIVVLCGNNTKTPIKAGSYAKNCLSWLKEDPIREDTTIYSVFYPKTQPLQTNLKPRPFFNYDKLANDLFCKLLYKDNKILSADKIAKNFGNITFMGHSMGGYVMNEIMRSLQKTLAHKNLTPEEINKIFSNITFVGYSPFRLVESPTNNIYITPVYDSMGSSKLSLKKMLDDPNTDISIPQMDISKAYEEINSSYFDFIDNFKKYTFGEDILFGKSGKDLFIIPDLLYYDGLKEDHNFAGVVNYNLENPYKTTTGKKTTQLMNDIFKTSLTVTRKDFSTDRLYTYITTNNANTIKKEL